MTTRKELKAQYKSTKPTAGVFQIENTANGKSLIEGSIDVISKWNRYRAELKFGSHRNIDLQNDWDQYKEESFNFKILAELEVREIKNENIAAEVKLLETMILEEERKGLRY